MLEVFHGNEFILNWNLVFIFFLFLSLTSTQSKIVTKPKTSYELAIIFIGFFFLPPQLITTNTLMVRLTNYLNSVWASTQPDWCVVQTARRCGKPHLDVIRELCLPSLKEELFSGIRGREWTWRWQSGCSQYESRLWRIILYKCGPDLAEIMRISVAFRPR